MAVFIIRTVNHFGKDESLEKALHNCEKARGRKLKKGEEYILDIYTNAIPSDLTVNEMGAIGRAPHVTHLLHHYEMRR